MSDFEFSMEFSYLEDALKSYWPTFVELEQEIQKFVPRPLADFGLEREAFLTRLKGLNPDSDDESLAILVDGQMQHWADGGWQFHSKFSKRVMTAYVNVVLVSHALTEAIANARIAIALADMKKPQLFDVFQKADLREKWCEIPMSWHPDFRFPKHGAIHESLLRLIRERNALTHNKILVRVDGEDVLKPNFRPQNPLNYLLWIRRFSSLPYDLCSHAWTNDPRAQVPLLMRSTPIDRCPQHSFQ